MTLLLKMRVLFFVYSIVTFDNKEPSDRWVPCPRGIENGWGPAATKMRDEGKLPPVVYTDDMRVWQDWGDKNLQSGDIIHRQGNAYIAHGLYPFSKALASITNSKYSHSAFVVIEEGHAYIYDATQQSVRRQPFSIYMLDMAKGWCVQRPSKLDVEKATDYVKGKWNEQVPFDFDLNSFDDSKLYCVEMLVRAYRAGGVDLGRPVPILLIPGIHKWPVTLWGFKKCGLKIGASVWYVGNMRNGILGSNKVKTIHQFDKQGVDGDRSDKYDPVRKE